MAESQSMTTAEVVAKTLIDEHADFLREAVAMVAAQIMEAEIAGEIGAGRGERSSDRATHRNGYRPRLWETRVGEIELAVPRKRSGVVFPRLDGHLKACVSKPRKDGVSHAENPTGISR